MSTLRSAIIFALLCGSLGRSAHSQTVVAMKYLWNEPVMADTGRAAWLNFAPVGPSGGSPHQCLTWAPALIGLPDYMLLAPSWEQRKAEFYLWYTPKGALSHVQMFRHEAPLPVRDTTGSRELVIDPFTPLTGHTVFLIDFGDSTIVAYNRRGGVPQRGVVAKIADVRKVPMVEETLRQIDEAWAMCQKKKNPK